ncbi:hypothetical protein ATCC90586_006689 [Pythium insidiosum]|nr:hypothetical protein ATCC90586_006689 [Pythium insidiosum]
MRRPWLQRVLAVARWDSVPRSSWSVFHPRVKLQPWYKNDALKLTQSPHLTFVQAYVPPSRFQVAIMRWGTVLAVSSAVYQFVTNLHSVPITGRTQVVALDQEEEIELGVKAAAEELKNAKIIATGPRVRMCVDVAARLVSVSEHLFPRQYDWRVWLVDAPSVANACCFPGGKMIIYSGILDVVDAAVEKGLVDNKHDALAVILAHEIAHALARHTAERMSFLPLLYIQNVLGLQSPLLQYIFEFAMNLPFSRKQEMEADHIGLMLMASACYDPRTASKFWKAFGSVLKSQDEENNDDEEIEFDFFSTHPSNKKREKVLESLEEEALEHQRQASWCQELKRRVQELIRQPNEQSDNPLAMRIRLFHSRHESKEGSVTRRATVGTVHQMENEEIYKAIRIRQQDPQQQDESVNKSP